MMSLWVNALQTFNSMEPIIYAMASLETTPMPIADAKQSNSRRSLFLLAFAGVLLAIVTAVLSLQFGADPLQRRLVGVWKLRQPLPVGGDERLVEFRDDGRYRVSRKVNGKYEPDSAWDGWRTSNGDLVLELTNPDPFARSASIGQRIGDVVKIMEDRIFGAHTDRYTVVEDSEDAMTFVPQSKNAQPFSLQRMGERPR